MIYSIDGSIFLLAETAHDYVCCRPPVHMLQALSRCIPDDRYIAVESTNGKWGIWDCLRGEYDSIVRVSRMHRAISMARTKSIAAMNLHWRICAMIDQKEIRWCRWSSIDEARSETEYVFAPLLKVANERVQTINLTDSRGKLLAMYRAGGWTREK